MRLDTSVVRSNKLRGIHSGRDGRNHRWHDGRNDRWNWRVWFADGSNGDHGHYDQAFRCGWHSPKWHPGGNSSLSLGTAPAWRTSASGSIWLWKSFGPGRRSHFPDHSVLADSRTRREHDFRVGAAECRSGALNRATGRNCNQSQGSGSARAVSDRAQLLWKTGAGAHARIGTLCPAAVSLLRERRNGF